MKKQKPNPEDNVLRQLLRMPPAPKKNEKKAEAIRAPLGRAPKRDKN